jgi:hypothetical protein
VGPKLSLALTPEAWVMSCLSRLSASGVVLLSSYVCLIKQITKCDKPKLSAQRTAGIRRVHRHLVSKTLHSCMHSQAVVSALGHRLAT